MELYGQKSKSIPQKVIIHLLEITFIYFSYKILFGSTGNFISDKLGIQNAVSGTARRKVIFAFTIIVFLRIAFMMLFLLKRKIPWEESVSVPFAFALYYVGFALFVLPIGKPIDGIDYCGIILFLVGSILNTGGEILRDCWKKDPANKGKLYTKGFFKYSIHINYFGDFLWVTAYAIVTRNWYSISIPIFLFCFFVFYNIPKLDQYLHQKYGSSFEDYAKRTKKFIPFIY
ncbi:MAG: DUF1295 domain-containing protein [Ginsengibacter sp.]